MIRRTLSRKSLRPNAKANARRKSRVRNIAIGFAVIECAVFVISACIDENDADMRWYSPGGGATAFFAGRDARDDVEGTWRLAVAFRKTSSEPLG